MAAVPSTIDIDLRRARGAATVREMLFQLLLLFSLLLALAILLVLVVDVVGRAIPVFQERGTDVLTSNLSSRPGRAGVAQGIYGSFLIAVITAVVAFPLGIATAVYLEEYAPDNWMTRAIDVNIRNLAGVPSIVYGLLGLAVFVRFFGPTDVPGGVVNLTGGRSIISAGLTVAALVLPIVIISSAEAIRAVSQLLREGGYGLGATRWEVVKGLVLPSATPGILTGTILALSRAIGETAPLLAVGATTGFLAAGNANLLEQLKGPFTALPMIVFNWSLRPQAAFTDLAAAAIVVLLVVTLFANAVAIVLRNHFEKKT